MHPVRVPRRPIAQLDEVIGLKRTMRMLAAAAEFRRVLGDRIIWNFSSTATGGGVAEMLQGIVGYTKDLAIDIRWSVIDGDADFFRITKRLHNRIHGHPGDHGELGPAERRHVEDVAAGNVAEVSRYVKEGDLVILHDPQTAAMIGPLARLGAYVTWRCHVGNDKPSDISRSGWEFLRPSLEAAHAYIFSRRVYAPDFLSQGRIWVVPPSIDPFSPKNQHLDPAVVRAIMTRTGLLSTAKTAARDAATAAKDVPDSMCAYTRRDGSPGEVTEPAWVTAEDLPGPDDPLVVQVSRWDRLKDMIGVMRGFSAHVAPGGPGWLMLVGPAVQGVTDDPEGATVFGECLAEWRRLPPTSRSRIVLASIAMSDVDDNAATINALQRHAAVIVQKSLAEGFGLTVAEGMWKGRPVVGSAVGGIQDQITEGTGVLLANPTDLTAFGHAVRRLLDDPALADRMGRAAREYVRGNYIGDLHLLRYANLFTTLLSPAAVGPLPG